MLRIGICDDEKETSKQLHDYISKVLFSYTDMKIQYFTDGNEIVELIKKEKLSLDLLFLDIHMNYLDGMKTADFIRKKDMDVDIIFITVSKEHVFEGYTYKAFAYWLKPLDEQRIRKDLVRYIEEKKNCSECLDIKIKGKAYKIPLNKIVYFESVQRKIIVHTLAEDITFYGKMSELEAIVSEHAFLRCHQSYMVNRSMIDSIGRTEIVAQGITIPLSRKYHKGMEDEMGENMSLRVTQSLVLNQEQSGAIVFTKGKLVGAIIRIKSNREIILGRSGNMADIVINDSKISRRHCSVLYDDKVKEYRIVDFSQNGLYTKDGSRLPAKTQVQVKPGDEIWIGSSDNIFQLG